MALTTTDIIQIVFGSAVFLLLLFFLIHSSWSRRKGKKRKKIKVDTAQKTLIQTKEPEIITPVETIEEHTEEEKGFNFLTGRKSKLSMRYWLDRWKDKQNPASTSLINMELLNGFHKVFLVKEKDGGFKFKGKKYLFDTEAKYFIIDSKIWAYDYHETFSLPIKRVIPVTKIRKTMEATEISQVEYATNPKTLEQFAVSKIAEGIMRGAELDSIFKFLRIMSIIILIVVLIHFLLYAQKSGIFDQIGGIV